MPSVVVTGLGCISGLGGDVPRFWDNIIQGNSAIGPLSESISSEFGDQVGVWVSGFEPAKHFPRARLSLLDRFTQFALVAARQAVHDASLKLDTLDPTRVAIILGTGAGARHTTDETLEKYYCQQKRIHPFTVPRGMSSAPVSHISMEFGIKGPAFTVTTACASANHAFGQAFALLNTGQVDVVICGATEACMTVPFIKAWQSMRILASDTCRPFSKDRKGLVLGEGAGIVVLETAKHAATRGARIYAELVGVGYSSDAGHITDPSVEGMAQAMNTALKSAQIDPGSIQYINAHGTGTVSNDISETQAIHQVFGDHASQLTVSSTKSMHGHALGASGALELIATLLAITHQIVPPTANYQVPDPLCDLDYVTQGSRKFPINGAMSNSFAFGGLNAVVVVQSHKNNYS